jgi:hypothetical protein
MAVPEMIGVDSSSIDAVGYDAAKRDLYVSFVESGETYAYAEVPEFVYQQLLLAPSKGRFVNRVIKRRYQFRRV